MATIQMTDVLDWHTLPIDAQAIATKIRLVIAGATAGEIGHIQQAFRTAVTAETRDYTPWPIVHEYTDPSHATYGVERSLALPPGFNPFLPPTSPLIDEPTVVDGFYNPGLPSFIRDGDPDSYGEFTAGLGNSGAITYGKQDDGSGNERKIYGFRLRYNLASDGTPTQWFGPATTNVRVYAGTRQAIEGDPFAGAVNAWGMTAALADVEVSRELYGVVPRAAWNAPGNGAAGVVQPFGAEMITLRLATNVATMQVFEFYPLILDEVLLDGIAAANIRLPRPEPKRVTVAGYLDPDQQHTIVGWPGGDYTGEVAQYQYDAGRTVIDFEQAGSPTGLPAEAMEAAKERANALATTTEVANYNLKMASRT